MFRKVVGLAVAMLALTLSVSQVWADGTPTPEADQAHEADSTEPSDRLPAGNASIRIVFPVSGTVLTNNAIIVKVETTNWPLGNGKHWHLYVNGVAQGMSQGSSPALQAHDLQLGENVLEAVMSNDAHQELDAVARVSVIVTSSVPGTDSTGLIIAAAGAMVVVGGTAVWLMRKK